MKYVLVPLAALVGLLGLSWLVMGNDFFLYKAFAPKYEQVRRETFEQTKSYNDGMIEELQAMRFEYTRSTKEQQETLRSIILHRAAAFPRDRMPDDLRSFIDGLESSY